MNNLQTPRPLPQNIDDWSDEIEELLSEWGEVSMCYAYLHNYSTRKYKKKYQHLQIPIIVLSTLTGVGNFAVDSYIPEDYQHGFTAVVGGLNIFCGILGTLSNFLKLSETMESHRIQGISWSKLGRQIQIELALDRKRRQNAHDFLKISRAEYDRLIESSPSIDDDIIRSFKSTFKNYKELDISVPNICNGLDRVSIFRAPTSATSSRFADGCPRTSEEEPVMVDVESPDSPSIHAQDEHPQNP